MDNEKIEAMAQAAATADVADVPGPPDPPVMSPHFPKRERERYLRIARAVLPIATAGMVPAPEGEFMPCPTCRRYSHSLGDDEVTKAFLHFQSMISHRGDGIPTQNAFDEATRDAAQVFVTALKSMVPKTLGDQAELVGRLEGWPAGPGDWQERKAAVLMDQAATAIQSLTSTLAQTQKELAEARDEAAEVRKERDALLQEPIDAAQMDSIDDDEGVPAMMMAYYWYKQAQEARVQLARQGD